MRRTLPIWFLVAGCGGGLGGGGDDDDGENDITFVGECDPAPDSTDLAASALDFFDGSCLGQDPTALQLVESEAEWDALFADCGRPVPAELDLTANRAAVVHVRCSPIGLRFTAESASEIVVGVLSRVSGACGGNILVVPLARSTKPVRLAQCQESCESCPPVP